MRVAGNNRVTDSALKSAIQRRVQSRKQTGGGSGKVVPWKPGYSGPGGNSNSNKNITNGSRYWNV